MIHVSCLSRFSKNYAFMVRPQMGHASLAVFAIPSSIAPEQASPAYDRFPLVYCLEAFDLHPVCPDLDNKAGRGVSQSLCYFHVIFSCFLRLGLSR